MRRGTAVGVTLLAIGLAVLIGVVAFHAGTSHGLTEATQGTRVVRVVGPGYGFGWAFFPFGFFLLFFGIMFLMRTLFWRRRWGGPGGPGGPGSPHWEERRRRIEEWHRRQHERGADHPSGTDWGTPGT